MKVNHQQLQLAIILKLSSLQKDGLSRLTYQQLYHVLMQWRWRKEKPQSLHQAVEDLFAITAEQVVIFLSKQALVDAQKQEISDFDDLIGGIRE